jgi:hypothetical protein
MNRIGMALLLVAMIGPGASGQDTAAAGAGEPTLAATGHWLSTDGVRLLVSRREKFIAGRDNDLNVRLVLEIGVRDCHLIWTDLDSVRTRHTFGTSKFFTRSTYDAPLNELDVGGVTTNMYGDDTTFTVRLPTRSSAGKPIRVVSSPLERGDTTTVYQQNVATLPVDNQHDGERVANAIKRAAVLCGAPASPF